MRFTLLLLTLLCSGFGLAPASAMADTHTSVTEKLETKKQKFLKTAEPQMITDFEQGIKDVAEIGVVDDAKTVGDTAPDFTLPNAAGEQVKLSDVLSKGPVALIWYRGEWCPYCNIYLEDIQSHIQSFKDIGAQVIAISPETPDRGWAIQDKLALDFHVLSDEGSHAAQDYGVVYTLPEKIAEYYQNLFDLHGKNNDDRNLLPLSASYVIDQSGKITYAFLDADYRKRADTKILLNEVKKLHKLQQ